MNMLMVPFHGLLTQVKVQPKPPTHTTPEMHITGTWIVLTRIFNTQGIEQLLESSPDNESLAYYDPNVESVRAALKDLRDYIISNGPFDAVLGFSQGASLAASFIAQQSLDLTRDARCDFKCAIFICGIKGVHTAGSGRILGVEEDGEIIQIPTVHIFGSGDSLVQESLDLSLICDHRTRVLFDHKGGHEVPRGAALVSEMAACISKALEKAILMQ